jgi:CubicO group peptidase (beta-lactamase class C family)
MLVKAFEHYAVGLLDGHGVPGAAAAASRDGVVVYERGFGSADVERGIPAGPDTVFGIASVTKSFTAAAIMRLAETGRLTVEDPVLEYLPEFRMPAGNASPIRVRHFLTHTPGFPPLPSRWYVFGSSARDDPDGATPPVSVHARPPIETPEDLMAYLAGGDWTPFGPPGAQFSYCNEGYALLGAIVARVSGRSYIRYVTEEILEPAGLRRTVFGPAPPWPSTGSTPTAGVTTPYIVRKGNGRREIVPARTWWYSDTWNPAGGVCSTVTDLVRYLELYRTGGTVGGQRILSQHSVAAMATPHLTVGPGQGYGYGLGVLPDYRGGPLIEHSGGRRSISAHVAVSPSHGFAVAALANLADAPVRALAHGLLNALRDVAPETPAIAYPDYAVSEARLAAYGGEYRSREGTVLYVSAAEGRLAIEADGERLSGRAVGPDAFVVSTRGMEQYVRFLIDVGDRAHAVAYGGRIIARTA